MWDIILAFLLWLLTAAMAYMGFHVTLHPPTEPRSKKFWKAGFIAVAILAAILIAIQAYRSYNSAQDLKAEIQKQGDDTRQAVREEGSRPIKVEMPPQPTAAPEISLRHRAIKLAGE